MSNILTIAYTVEGTTDERFLQSIIQRTFEEVAFVCPSDIEVFTPLHIQSPKSGEFKQDILESARIAYNYGMHVLCVHTDADASSDVIALNNKINPAFEEVYSSKEKVCQNLVPIVPIRMSESWMLADKDLLRAEIPTLLSASALGIDRKPEGVANPKSLLEEVLRIAQRNLPSKRTPVKISDLYQPLGQKLSIRSLETLKSYQSFKEAVISVFKKLNYIN